MKKRILTLVIAFILCLPNFMAFAEEKVIFSDSFEESFSAAPKDWNIFGLPASIKAETKNVADGKQAISVVDDSTTAGGGVESPKFDVTVGKTYEFRTEVFNNSGGCSMYAKFWDANNKQLIAKSTTNNTPGKWRSMSVVVEAPLLAVKGSVVLCINGSVVGDVIYDNFRVIEYSVEQTSGYVPFAPTQNEPSKSNLITPDGSSLKYSNYNEQGDKLSDFSYAGFYKGEIDLPDVAKLPIGATASPSSNPDEDDTARLQAIIDEVSKNTPNGCMQVVKLDAGKYNINKSGLYVREGVVLLGSGQGPTGTVLYSTTPAQHTTVRVSGGKPTMVGGKVNITDDYLNVGNDKINVTDTTNFKVGDTIVIYQPSTEEWAKGIGMSNIINVYGNLTSWTEGKVDMTTERVIKEINGTTITLDFPLYVPYDKKLAQSYIYKIDESEKVENFGIENLRVESSYNGSPTDEEHANVGVAITNAKNGYVRNVSAKHYILAAVRCSANSKQITVQNCSSLEPISTIAGSRRYSFGCSTSAQQILFTGCYSFDGRHDYTTSYSCTGPIVFLDNVADKSNTASETHGTWSTGLLYDNVYQISNETRGFIALANRGTMGTALSQGWSGAGSVIWNSLASTIIAHKLPSTYQNFLIGTWGRYLDPRALSQKESNISSYMGIYRTDDIKFADDKQFATTKETPFVGDAYKEAETTPVEPRSLYKAQLSSRISNDYRNVKPNSPIISSPRQDAAVSDKAVSITGIYQLGAKKVSVYVDDKPYDAKLDSETNTFLCEVNLENGYHKIYATQTINDVESTKTTDRFIAIGDVNKKQNPFYLQSVYSRDKTALITSDNRPTFDEYQMSNVKVVVNGKSLVSDVAPQEISGRVLVPMRAIFEELGATLAYDESSFTATATLGDIIVKITENNEIAYVGEKETKLDVPATIIDGRFMVPVRFIAESFGAKVDWNGDFSTVLIDK